jgi:hypothetical protein
VLGSYEATFGLLAGVAAASLLLLLKGREPAAVGRLGSARTGTWLGR